MTQFDRRIIVEASDLIITEPRITAFVQRDVDSSNDTAEVTIYNLARTTEAQITERRGRVAVTAGYAGQTALIFAGEISQVDHLRRIRGGVARITRLKVEDFAHPARPATSPSGGRLGATARAYAGPVTVRRIIGDLAADLGLRVGPLDAVPATATVTDFVWSGHAADALTVLAARVGGGWYEDDGVVRVRRKGAARQTDQPRFLVTPSTGLVGSPNLTDDGLEITTLLNPALTRGGQVRVESELVAGDFVVVSMAHSADNREGRFITWAALRPFGG